MSISPYITIRFLLYIFWRYFYEVPTNFDNHIFLMNWNFYHHEASLILTMLLPYSLFCMALIYVYQISSANTTDIFFLSFCYYSRCILIRYSSIFKTQYTTLGLFLTKELSFIFNVIIKIFRFKSAILLYSICHTSSSVFSSHFFFFGRIFQY